MLFALALMVSAHADLQPPDYAAQLASEAATTVEAKHNRNP